MPEIIYQKKEHIAYITISNPQKMNAVTSSMTQQWQKALTDFRDDPQMRVALITGAGDRAFSTGPDMSEEAGPLVNREEIHAAFWRGPTAEHYWKRMEIWKPIIAAVNGYCLAGGLEMALIADIIIASETASFGLAEASLSRMPGWGGTQKLSRRTFFGAALYMLLTAERIDAQEAFRIGLVNKVVPQAQLMAEAEKTAQKLASYGPLALRAIKELAWKGVFEMSLSQGLRMEEMYSRINKDTEDAMEGPRAWLEKRPPQYKGK